MKKLFLMLVLLSSLVATGCKSSTPRSASDASESSEASSTSQEASVSENSNVDTDALIDELIQVTDMEDNVEASLNAMFSQMGYEDKELVAKVKKEIPQITKEIYTKYFTDKELKELLEMSKDEVSQKMSKNMPKIVEESFAEARSYALGEQGPNTDVTVSDEFKEAMTDYFEAVDFDKQMEQMNQELNGSSQTEMDDVLPGMMMRIFSKYFTVDEIKHATELGKLPISKKFREKQIPMAKEMNEKMQKIVMDHLNSKK